MTEMERDKGEKNVEIFFHGGKEVKRSIHLKFTVRLAPTKLWRKV